LESLLDQYVSTQQNIGNKNQTQQQKSETALGGGG
jgi:hypothetical protein